MENYMIMSWARVMFIGSKDECESRVRKGERIEPTNGQTDLVVGLMYRFNNHWNSFNGRWILA